MSGHRLDVQEFHRRLDLQRTDRGLSWRDVAGATGLSPSTLSRIADGHRPDADALVSLLVWLDLDTDLVYLIKPRETQ